MAKRYYLTAKQVDILRRRAFFFQEQGDQEVCGVLLADAAGNLKLRFLPNISHQPYCHTMSAASIRNVARCVAGRMTVIGSFHSHPIGEAKPSRGDIQNGFYKGVELIYDVCGQNVAVWRLKRNRGIRCADRVSLTWSRGRPEYTFTL